MRTGSVRFLGLGMASIVLLLAVMSCTALKPPAPDKNSAEWKIKNAMSAAPMAIAKDATIMDWPTAEGAPPTQLRAGTNGWLCYPDDLTTPTNDPMCLDQVWQALIQAYVEKKPFSTQVGGFGYMLQGGSGASNTDPFKLAPGPGEQWMICPPHVMWVSPDPAALAGFSTEPLNGGPWIMWKGTPYEHVMIPVVR